LTEQAKVLLRKDQRERALLLLKLRKYKEKEVLSADSKLLSVQEMIQNVEWEYSNMEVMRALKSGTDALNKMHEEMSLEDVENILEETQEAIEVCQSTPI
jgi:RPA family protein